MQWRTSYKTVTTIGCISCRSVTFIVVFMHTPYKGIILSLKCNYLLNRESKQGHISNLNKSSLIVDLPLWNGVKKTLSHKVCFFSPWNGGQLNDARVFSSLSGNFKAFVSLVFLFLVHRWQKPRDISMQRSIWPDFAICSAI